MTIKKGIVSLQVELEDRSLRQQRYKEQSNIF
jgi:hypothetical protein